MKIIYIFIGKNKTESSEEDESDESDDDNSSDASEEVKVSNFIESTRQTSRQPTHQTYGQVSFIFVLFIV